MLVEHRAHQIQLYLLENGPQGSSVSHFPLLGLQEYSIMPVFFKLLNLYLYFWYSGTTELLMAPFLLF